MQNNRKSEEFTRIGMLETHNEIGFDPVIGAVPILDENDITDLYHSLNRNELEALTNGPYFQSLQY